MAPGPNAISAAQAAQKALGIPASVTLAQYGQESGWGAHMPPNSNNPFGIKAVPGQPYVLAWTHEFLHGRYVRLQAPFLAFPTLGDAFMAHALLLAHGAPYQAARQWLAPGAPHWDVWRFCNALTGIYATDPRYGSELIELIREGNLEQYDNFPEAT